MTERRLRPQSWDDLIGNDHWKLIIRRLVSAAKERGEQPEHILFDGPPGLGKTAMSVLTQAEISDGGKRSYAGQSSAEITAELYALDGGEAIFIDELHALAPEAVEIVQLAMEGTPVGGRFDAPVAPWTLIGATTKPGQIEAPIRDRFGLTVKLDYYPDDEIAQIAGRSAEKLDMELQPKAADEVATRSRGVPRIANRLLRRVRDVYNTPTPRQVDEVLVELGVDSWGLETCDRALLMLMYERFEGGPVGLRTIAAASGIDPQTLAEGVEPYLLRAGLIDVRERGRQLTAAGFAYCKLIRSRLDSTKLKRPSSAN